MSARYAIYWAPPPGAPLDLFGASWLGRCAWSGETRPQPVIPGLSPPDFAALTARPRCYGLHATLKAPFRLATGYDEADLRAAITDLARRFAPVPLPLALDTLRGFLALTGPAETPPALAALAAACVTELDRFRAPLTAADIARRNPDGLDPVERDYLDRWGYPYIFDRFRFHVTLSGPLDAVQVGRLETSLRPRLAPLLAAPVLIDGLCLFAQSDAAQPFRVLGRIDLGG